MECSERVLSYLSNSRLPRSVTETIEQHERERVRERVLSYLDLSLILTESHGV